MSDTRRYPRFPCFVAVELRAKDPDLFALGSLTSVGEGGCGVETETPLSVGALVEVAPVEGEDVRVIGHVANRLLLVEKPGFALGIEFTDTEERVAAFIKSMDAKGLLDGQAHRYVKSLRRREGEVL